MGTKDLTPRDKGTFRERWFDEPFTALQRSINEEFDRFTRRWSTGGWEPVFGPALMPAINISEKDHTVHVEAELPGVDAKDVEVTVEDNMLVLKGERKEEKEEDRGNTYRRERRYGRFERQVRLPCRVKADNVNATFKQGVLVLDLPVLPEDPSRSQKIAVNGE